VSKQSTADFAEELEKKLNALSSDGYGIAHIFFRDEGESIVVVGQKTEMPSEKELRDAGIHVQRLPVEVDPTKHN
jgi:hypothetical protein